MHSSTFLNGTNAQQAVSLTYPAGFGASFYLSTPAKYLSAFCKGPAYAEILKTKMKNVEIASEAMNERASQRGQKRLQEIHNITLHSMVVL